MNRAKPHWWNIEAALFGLGLLFAFVASSLAGCSEERRDVDWPLSERELVAEQQYALLHEGAVPIDQAMASLSEQGRLGHPAIHPEASEDFSAMEGWSYGGTVVPTGDVAMPIECEGAPDPMACWGEKIRLQKGCIACHAVDGLAEQPGPNWKGLFGKDRLLTTGDTLTADEEYLRVSISDPWSQIVDGYGKVMPPSNLQEPEVEAVIAYIKSLGAS